MRRKLSVAIALGAALSVTATSGIAHHSFASQFDAEKRVRLTGTVTKIEWRNPHAWFYIDVEEDDGTTANWGWELASPNLLMRNGWPRSAMKVGDEVTVEGFHARDGSNTANVRTVLLLATGKTLSMGSSYQGGGQ